LDLDTHVVVARPLARCKVQKVLRAVAIANPIGAASHGYRRRSTAIAPVVLDHRRRCRPGTACRGGAALLKMKWNFLEIGGWCWSEKRS
jgi:hypothetical protein